MKKRLYVSNEPKYIEVIGIERNYFVRKCDDVTQFYTGRSDFKFSTLNMAQIYTLKDANEIIRGLKINCESVKLENI